jgi:uncharacterized membrane protein
MTTLQRLASLSDCVFAVAMTLLAFTVRIPEQGLDRAKLPGELIRMCGESYGLVLSFAITAMFWIGHVRLLRSLNNATLGLVYLTFLQLFWIVLLPISTSLWIRIEARETVLVMGGNLTLIAVCGLLMWTYSYRSGLCAPQFVALEIIGRIFPLSLFIGSLIVAFCYPLIADKLWWGAFATPLLIHLVRTQSWVKPPKEKVAFDQEDETGRRPPESSGFGRLDQ